MHATWHVKDALFGSIELELVVPAGLVTVSGRGVPTVVVRRLGVGDEARVPIGTRDPRNLEMSVDGVVTPLRPSRARFFRRSFRVRAGVDGSALLSAPWTTDAVRIVRGCRMRPQHQLGIAERLDDGTVAIEWHADVTVPGHILAAPRPTPTEAAVAYAVTVAFGPGSRMLLPVLLELVLAVPFVA